MASFVTGRAHPLSEDATSRSDPIEASRLTRRDLSKNGYEPIHLQREAMLGQECGSERHQKSKRCELWLALFPGLLDHVDLARQAPPQLCKVRFPEPW